MFFFHVFDLIHLIKVPKLAYIENRYTIIVYPSAVRLLHQLRWLRRRRRRRVHMSESRMILLLALSSLSPFISALSSRLSVQLHEASIESSCKHRLASCYGLIAPKWQNSVDELL